MASGPKLDGPGTIKLVTLEEALIKLQGLHGVVERMAVEVKNSKPIGPLALTLKRAATPMQGMLKAQFSLIADQITGMLLIATRGGPDKMKVRSFRETVAQVRTQLEIAIIQVKEKHLVVEKDDTAGDAAKTAE